MNCFPENAALKSFSPGERKLMREAHPFYRRVGGEAAWMLMEEAGLEGEALERAMEAFIDTRRVTLEQMLALREDPFLHAEIRCDGLLCAECRPLAGREFSSREEEWLTLLPPYAVGCRMYLVLLETRPDFFSGGREVSRVIRPACPLVCPHVCPKACPQTYC